MTERERLLAAVLADRADPAPKLVYADWLADSGAKPWEVYVYRWMARHGRYPLERADRVKLRWVWLRQSSRVSGHSRWMFRRHPHAVLPRGLWDRFARPSEFLAFGSWHVAVAAVAPAVWEQLGEVALEVPE